MTASLPANRIKVTSNLQDRLERVRAARANLHTNGPAHTRPFHGDFERVAVPAADADVLRDALIADNARLVIEIGLAYGSSALAIAEALCTTGQPDTRHIIIDPFQESSYRNAGWDALAAAGVADRTTFFGEPSSVVLPRLMSQGLSADAAFVDGSHRFHEVFVDLYYLRRIVRPGGLILMDDVAFSSVATALRYFERNLGWEPVALTGRLTARRLPLDPSEPEFTDFAPF